MMMPIDRHAAATIGKHVAALSLVAAMLAACAAQGPTVSSTSTTTSTTQQAFGSEADPVGDGPAQLPFDWRTGD